MSLIRAPRIQFLNPLWVLLHDLLMVPIAWIGAYWLRFNLGVIPHEFLRIGLQLLVPLVILQGVSFWWSGMYRGVWRFASVPDLIRILKAVAAGVLITTIFIFLYQRMEGVPRSVPLVYGMLLVLLLAGPRFVYRWTKEYRIHISSGKRVLVVGAGRAGEMLARDLLRHHQEDYIPVGFVDDSRRRQKKDIHGLPVLGSCDSLPGLVKKLDIDVVMLAVPSANSKQMQRLVGYCEDSGVPFRTLPDLKSLVSGEVAVNQLRQVSIVDLLGREPVTLDWQCIHDGLSAKRVLVTGGGGSIGAELCRQIAQVGPGHLIVCENSEHNLFQISQEFVKSFPQVKFAANLCDVTDSIAVDRLFSRFKPDVIFHAAAFKHVPMLESQIREAVRNNIIGTQIVAEAAVRHEASKFVLISSDKAVNPTNVMGSTKRIAEIFCQNLNPRVNTAFVTVRFGNVLDSAGSVVPIFREQIARGGPVTVTDPAIERYFLTIPEACQLIMEAAVIGEGGEIFVLDMGEPVKIRYLAEQMIRLSGKDPERDIEIIYTGLRPGEKLSEELFHENEVLRKTSYEKILLAKHREVEWEALSRKISLISKQVDGYDEIGLMESLQWFVPEYTKHKDANNHVYEALPSLPSALKQYKH